MKKGLLILLCLPMIGFGQVDCGDEPQEPKKDLENQILNIRILRYIGITKALIMIGLSVMEVKYLNINFPLLIVSLMIWLMILNFARKLRIVQNSKHILLKVELL